MKYKRAAAVLVAIGLIGLAGGVGFYLGNLKESPVMETSAADKVAKQETESTLIAVVNLDEGVADNKEKINYADKIIQFPNTSFEYASLEEARSGLESGKYGAYVIIPATFSQSVASINTTPQPAQIEYSLNKELSGKSQYALLYDVLSFSESLNNSLSYMYLNDILKEFHDAQDGAATVMNNDVKDKDAIDSIQPQDLIQMVQVPEMKHEKNKTKTLDVNEYVIKNTELVSSVEEEYMKCVTDIQEQIDNLREEGNNLSDVLKNLSSDVQKIDISKDKEGNSIAETAEKKLSSILAEEAEGIREEETQESEETQDAEDAQEEETGVSREDNREIPEQIIDLIDGTENIENELVRSIDKNRENAAQELKNILESYRNDIAGRMPELKALKDGTGGYIISFEDTDTDTSPAIQVKIKEYAGNAENNKKLVQAIAARIVQAQTETEITDISISADGKVMATECEIDKRIKTALEECDGDPQIQAMLATAGYTSTTKFLNAVSQGSVALENEKDIEITGDWTAFKNYLIQKVGSTSADNYKLSGYKDIAYDENGNIQYDENGNEIHITDLLQKHKKLIEDTKESGFSYHQLDADSIKKFFMDEYVTPLEKNVEEAKQAFMERYNSEMDAVAFYNEMLFGYNPSDMTAMTEFITKYTSETAENNTLLQKKLTENNKSYVDFANKVYTTAEKNVSNLQKHIVEAKESSEEAVTNGLSEAKEVKKETSYANQNILADFAAKLPYTRLGSMEYTQAYQFIANPVNVVDKSVAGDKANNKTKTGENSTPVDSGQTQTKESDVIPYVIYGIFGILVVGLIIVLVRTIGRHKEGEQ